MELFTFKCNKCGLIKVKHSPSEPGDFSKVKTCAENSHHLVIVDSVEVMTPCRECHEYNDIVHEGYCRECAEKIYGDGEDYGFGANTAKED